MATYYWDKANRDFRLADKEKIQFVQDGLGAVDKAIAIKSDYMEAIAYKNLLLRLQANLEKDPKKQQELLKEADRAPRPGHRAPQAEDRRHRLAHQAGPAGSVVRPKQAASLPGGGLFSCVHAPRNLSRFRHDCVTIGWYFCSIFRRVRKLTAMLSLPVRLMRPFLIAVCVLALSAAHAAAQGVTTGSMTGVVTDSQMSPVSGASVIAIHAPSGTNYEATTRADGRFTIIGMRVGGPYIVTVAYTGTGTAFEPQTRRGPDGEPRRVHRRQRSGPRHLGAGDGHRRRRSRIRCSARPARARPPR